MVRVASLLRMARSVPVHVQSGLVHLTLVMVANRMIEALLTPPPTVQLEHIPRVVMNVYRPGCMQCSYNRRDISADAHRTARAAIAYTVFVYGHIQGVGVTAYRIYWRGGAKCYEK